MRSGSKQEPQRISRNGDTPQVWYQVLKLFGICPLPESLQTCIIQQNNHYCLCCLSVCSWKPTYSSTLDLNQGTGVEVGESKRVGGWVAGTEGRVSDVPWIFFFGATPALRAPAPPTTPLTCTLIYLSSVGNPMLSLFLKVTQTLRQLERKHNMLLNHRSDTDVGQEPPKRVELANLSLKKTKAWVEYAHASSYTVYTQEYIMGVCVYMARSLCFPLSLSPPSLSLPCLQPCVSSSTIYFPEDKIINISE